MAFWTVILALLALAQADVVLKINTTLIDDGDWVKLDYTGVPAESRAGCFIGIYSPANVSVAAIPPIPYPATAPWTETASIKYQLCTADPAFNATGSGSYAFTLLDMREDVAFYLFYGGIDKPVAQAKSDVITFKSPNSPRHGMLALTGDPTQMRVTWNSKFADDFPQVKYIIDSQAYVISATSYTYTTDDLCGYPAKSQGWRDPGYFHTAIIKGLKPGQDSVTYSYGNDKYGYSAPKTFKASQPVNPDAVVHILATADVGASEADHCHYHWEEPDAHLTYQHITDLSPADVTLHIGDISYATGYSAKWDLFMHQATAAGSITPVMTAQGNHEQDSPAGGEGTFYGSNDSGGECGHPTEARFPMPTKSHDQYTGWYSFDMGSVHIIMLSTELECGPGSDQYDFLQQDLKAVNRSATPWIILGGHRPMYYVEPTGGYIDKHFQQFEQLMVDYKVDLALWGHVHNALVTCPIANGTCVTTKQADGYDAPIHAVIGNGGQSLDAVPNPAPAWMNYQVSEFGYSTITVYNSTTLEMKLFNDESNDLHYNFVLQRKFPRTA